MAIKRTSPKNDLTGKKFGKLKITHFGYYKLYEYPNCTNIYNQHRRKAIWIGQCDCGNICESDGTLLTSGKKNSCGCKRLDNIKLAQSVHTLPIGVGAFRSYYKKYIDGAKIRKIKFSLSKKQFEKIIYLNCHYCNSKPRISFPHKNATSNGRIIVNGIDRKDNDKGYTVSNCLPCCKMCNMAKKNSTYEDFILWINRLKEHTIV